MKSSFRQTEILDIARRDGKVMVDDLAAHFGVTVQTIRRDLSDLDDGGLLARVHGGAVLKSGTTNLAYGERQKVLTEEKLAIARICAAEIPDDCSIFLNIGTSTEAVAAELLNHRNLLVVTNNLNIAHILERNPDCEVIVTGGTLRRGDGGLIGAITVDAIRRFKFDVAVMGCSALDAEGDVLDYDIQEVGVSQSIIAQARRAFLVADHSKFQRSAPGRICSLADVDALFTDRALPRALSAACQDWGTEVHVAFAADRAT
ncbi:DeoR family transcriptional regulator [Rhodobacterales bacterium HKCCE4037]|nr:DeoR family transcriptional regulator [Rhodobacterales bacterium HKCCE4037]